MECQVIITKKIGTFTTENVGFKKRLVELKCNRKVFEGLVENAQTCICPSTSQMKLSSCLLFLLDGHVKITKCCIEIVHLEVQQASKEIQTRLLLLLAAAFNSDVQELTSLIYFIILGCIIDVFILQ